MKLQYAVLWLLSLVLMYYGLKKPPAREPDRSRNEVCRGELLQEFGQPVYEFHAQYGRLPTKAEFFHTLAKDLMSNYVDCLSFVADVPKNRYRIQEQRLENSPLIDSAEHLLSLDTFRGLGRHEPGGCDRRAM